VTPGRCSDLSRAAGEPVHATALVATSWLLLEVPGPWPRDVAAEGALPAPAAEAARAWLERTPGSRMLFLRHPERGRRSLAAFVVRSSETDREVRRLELGTLEELASVELDREGETFADPLVLVCGHGSRDACCARRGTAVLGALARALPGGALWASSHQGGHRFAANVLLLPPGLHLARVEPEDAERVVARALGGTIELERYRGRTWYQREVQAAEHAVRVAHGLAGVDDVRLVDVSGNRVRLADGAGAMHEAVVERRGGPVVPASCGAEPEPQTVLLARVV